MRETLALALLDLRLRLRQPAALAWGVLPLAVLALGAFVAGSGGAPMAATWFACVLGALALLLAAASAAQLPDDRESGRAPWLASLAPAPWARRLAAGGSGFALALAAALVGALLVGLLAPALGLARPLWQALPLSKPARASPLPEAAHEVRLAAPLATASTLEVTVRRGRAALLPGAEGREDVAWSTDAGASGREAVARGTRLRVPLPVGTRTVQLHLADAGLAWRSGWLLSEPRSWTASWLWVGALLGLGIGWLALAAAAVSRVTSAATAALSVIALVLLAAMRGVLPDLSGLPALTPLQQGARAVLESALFLAPDFSGLTPALDPAAGRALGPATLAGLAVLAPHALASVLLLLLPGRGAVPEGGA